MKLIYAPPLLPLFQVIDAEWIGTEGPIFIILWIVFIDEGGEGGIDNALRKVL